MRQEIQLHFETIGVSDIVRIHPRQGTSDPHFAWGDRENIIYEVVR